MGDARRWLFADQLGDQLLDAPDQPVLLIEARSVLRGRRFHRQKAHLVLSALRHRAAESAYRTGRAPLASVEGYVRQLIGWRDYMWHLYWHFGPGYRRSNALEAHRPLSRWFDDLDADAVEARCLSWALAQVRDHGFTHHIVRLMMLGDYGLQQGVDPGELAGWFHRSFVDGYDEVMIPNVVGMSQHTDGGRLATMRRGDTPPRDECRCACRGRNTRPRRSSRIRTGRHDPEGRSWPLPRPCGLAKLAGNFVDDLRPQIVTS
jgi:deoxyribodipyrimidine photolyase-like uncharacterized protein